MDMLAAVLKQPFVWYTRPLKAELTRMVEAQSVGEEGRTGMKYKGRRAMLLVASFLAGLTCQRARPTAL